MVNYAKKTHITTLLMFLGIMINVGLNIPFIINWGIIGAAWATTISGVFMVIISYFFAQKYVKIIWLWKIVLLIYAIFLIAVMFSIIDYHFSLPLYPLHLYLTSEPFYQKIFWLKKQHFY
jgi:O-antigen/teichoic acid export membrane protein